MSVYTVVVKADFGVVRLVDFIGEVLAGFGSIEAKAEDAPLLSAAGDSSGLESTIKRYALRYDFSYSGVSLLSI